MRMGPVAAVDTLADAIGIKSTNVIMQRTKLTRPGSLLASRSKYTEVTAGIVFTMVGLKQTLERLTTILEGLRSNENPQNELDSAVILPYRRHRGSGELRQTGRRG